MVKYKQLYHNKEDKIINEKEDLFLYLYKSRRGKRSW